MGSEHGTADDDLPEDSESWLGLLGNYTDRLKKIRHPEPLQLLVLGGGSVAGKSVLAGRMQGISKINQYVLPRADEAIAQGFMYISADFIRELYPDSFPGTGRHPEKHPGNIARYYKLRDRMALQCLEKGISVLLDDHCDDVKPTRMLMDEVHKINPPVQTGLIGYFAGPEARKNLIGKANKARTAKPQQQEDLMVMLKRMRDTSMNFRILFDQNIRLFDFVVLMENLWDGMGKVASFWSEGDSIKGKVCDREAYARFFRIAPGAQPAITEAPEGEKRPQGNALTEKMRRFAKLQQEALRRKPSGAGNPGRGGQDGARR